MNDATKTGVTMGTRFVGVRIPEGLFQNIVSDINTNGDYSTISQWILAACREYYKIRLKDGNGGGGALTKFLKICKKKLGVSPCFSN